MKSSWSMLWLKMHALPVDLISAYEAVKVLERIAAEIEARK